MKDYTDINVVLGTGLSTIKIKEDFDEGFNRWLHEQRTTEGEAKFSLTTFNHFFNPVYLGVDIKAVPDFFVTPSGNTALYDAIGKTIKAVGYRLDKLAEEEKPNKVLVIIITNGVDDCSKLYDLEEVKTLIKHQDDKYNWEFVFLGANMDAEKLGDDLGIPRLNSLRVTSNSQGVLAAYKSLSARTTAFRKAAKVTFGFFDWDDKKKQTTAGGVFSDPY